ncbi:hypothetical protein HZY95_05105 [Staphylococcus sciuri]|uniref:hypothetical protein n=1 Tax=Mammaliicoccus sciuri TaxID=1296 RepID=UPI0015CFC949|nr:hypothetical protein [Mammaliicoccus sciuri]MBF0719110.1 hypothetical protein [Mammaliicoccus sciuri]NYS37871.1 hypothetical protein [Mammaliicoccus sciuri]
MEIKYNNYANVLAYKARHPMDVKARHPMDVTNQILSANKLTLIRGAITVGLAPKAHLNLSRELLEWKIATMLAFIDTNSLFTIKNVNDLEMSERVTVAYFIGMVFAQIHMQKMYNVRHLEHLKSPGIGVVSRPGDLKNPDLWGIDLRTGQSYLVEAKGSTASANYFDNTKITKAETQLNAIRQINHTVAGITKVFNGESLKKLIIATHPNINNEMMQHIIDPIEENQKIINVQGNEMIYKHYMHLANFLRIEDSKVIQISRIPDVKFRVINLEMFNCSIGLLEDIYQVLKPKLVIELPRQKDLLGINEEINSILDTYELEFNAEFQNDEKYSIGNDGVIVINNDYEVM